MPVPCQSRFHDTVSALAYALASQNARAGDALLQPPHNDLARFILGQHGRMPDFLRLPLAALTLGFDAASLVRSGHCFRHLPIEARQRQIDAWRNSRLGVRRDLIRYFESLSTLALHSRTSDEPEPSVPMEADVSGVIRAPEQEYTFEIAVIGSGPGGAITACLLAEAGRNVLLIEEGPFYGLDSCTPFSRREMEQKYRNGGQTVAMGKSKVAYVEGRCVGGGSEINSGLYHRTPPDVLESWRREFAVESLREEDLRPHFESCERDLSVSHMPEQLPMASLKLHEGAVALGWKSMEVPRWFRYGAGGASTGSRQSMTQTFIPRFLRAGGRLLPRTRVESLRREGGKWLLRTRHGEAGPLRITAETVFVAGGAVQTPALLRRSGIKDNIGNSLRLHPTIKVTARFTAPVNAADMGVPVHQVKEFAPRLSLGCSISTPPYLALGLLDHPEAAMGVRDSWRTMANYYAMITGEGRGSVRPLPGFQDPLVRYNLPAADRRDLADGLRKLCEALFESGARTIYPAARGLPPLSSMENLKTLPEMLAANAAHLMTIHLFSSCPMGEDRSKCAADSFGRIHGFQNLLVADASLLCGAPGVNPQGSIMAIARRNANYYLNRR